MLSSVSTLKFKQNLIKKFLIQFVVMTAFTAAIAFWDILFAVSFGLGALTLLVTSGIFAFLMFRKPPVNNSKTVMRNFYLAEMLKLCIASVCFWAIFQWQQVIVVGLFLGFIIAQIFAIALFVKTKS